MASRQTGTRLQEGLACSRGGVGQTAVSAGCRALRKVRTVLRPACGLTVLDQVPLGASPSTIGSDLGDADDRPAYLEDPWETSGPLGYTDTQEPMWDPPSPQSTHLGFLLSTWFPRLACRDKGTWRLAPTLPVGEEKWVYDVSLLPPWGMA